MLTLVSHLAHELSMDFGDTIDGAGPLYTEVWGGVSGRGGTKGTNGARDKETQAMFCSNVQDIVQA